jgi:Flp pilus assembly pilin Flp
MGARIQKFCGGEIGALTLEYALIAAGFSTAIVALVSGVPF